VDAGVVHDNIDAAVGLHRGVDHRLDLFGVRDVGDRGHGVATVGVDGVDRLGDGGFVDVVDDDGAALAGEALGDGSADALTCARHDDDLAVE